MTSPFDYRYLDNESLVTIKIKYRELCHFSFINNKQFDQARKFKIYNKLNQIDCNYTYIKL